MRIDDIAQLPPAMQRQLAAKMATGFAEKSRAERAKTKYRNQPTEANGIRFDSKKEAERYSELMLMQEAGKITDLRLQQEFTLKEAFTAPDGTKSRAIRYRADFTYKVDGKLVIEDTKSEATAKDKSYRLKKKLMEERGWMITEV